METSEHLMINQIKTNQGDTIYELSNDSKVLLVFLRHFGCTFCREGLTDLLKIKDQLFQEGITPIIVHQSNEHYASRLLKVYELADLHRISDPHLELYEHFNLQKGKFQQIFGPKMIWRFFAAGIMKGHLVGKEMGDGWQMPGIFIIEKGEVINKYIHKYAGDRPDYLTLALEPKPVVQH